MAVSLRWECHPVDRSLNCRFDRLSRIRPGDERIFDLQSPDLGVTEESFPNSEEVSQILDGCFHQDPSHLLFLHETEPPNGMGTR